MFAFLLAPVEAFASHPWVHAPRAGGGARINFGRFCVGDDSLGHRLPLLLTHLSLTTMASFALDWPTAAVILGLAALWVYHSGQNQHAACRCHDCTRIRAGHVPTPTPTVIATSAPAIQAVATPVPSTSPSPVVPVFPSAPAASLVSPCPTPPLEIVPPSLVGFAEEKAQQVQDEQDEQDRTATRILAPTPVQVQRVASSLPCAAEYNEVCSRPQLSA